MVIEFSLHVLPPLRSSIEVDANLIWECLVDYSGGRIGHGFGHIVRLHAVSFDEVSDTLQEALNKLLRLPFPKPAERVKA